MTTEEILNLDFRKEENKLKIQKALKIIKPLKNEVGIITLEKLEELVEKYCIKYEAKVLYIKPIHQKGEQTTYTALIRTNTYNYIYGCCLYELFAKICICLFSLSKNGKMHLRGEEE